MELRIHSYIATKLTTPDTGSLTCGSTLILAGPVT